MINSPKERVVLLHGLAGFAWSMRRMDSSLQAAGFETCSLPYPSLRHSVETLAADFIVPAILQRFPEADQGLHFVTHSLGGILVRQIAAAGLLPDIRRVVMLSPPNQGSELVDRFGKLRPFRVIFGPAGLQLGTGETALPRRLGPAPFELGVITGTRPILGLLSRLIPGPNDGRVSVARAHLDGMRDFLAVPCSHTFIMLDPAVIEQTVHFLKHGEFF